jgi:hypothetical protein
MISLKLTVTGKPLNLGRHQIEISCPRCRLHTWMAISDALNHNILICRGCHANLLLNDNLGSLRRSLRSLDSAFNSLFRRFS